MDLHEVPGPIYRRKRGWYLRDQPTAERIQQRQVEQERRRRQALAAQIDINMQSDIMTEFEESLSPSVPESASPISAPIDTSSSNTSESSHISCNSLNNKEEE